MNEKTDTPPHKNKPQRPKYNAWQNAWWMLKLAWEEKEKKQRSHDATCDNRAAAEDIWSTLEIKHSKLISPI